MGKMGIIHEQKHAISNKIESNSPNIFAYKIKMIMFAYNFQDNRYFSYKNKRTIKDHCIMNKKLLTVCITFATTAFLIAQASMGFDVRGHRHNGSDSTRVHNDSTQIFGRDSIHHHSDSLFHHSDSLFHHSDSIFHHSDSAFHHHHDSIDVNRPDTTGHKPGHNGDVNRPDTTGHGPGHNGDVNRPDTTGHGHNHGGDVNRPDTTGHGPGHNGDVNRPDTTSHHHGYNPGFGRRDSTFCRPDTGEIARPDTVAVPTIKGRQVVAYPETYSEATSQSLSFSLVGDSLRMQGDIVSLGSAPHYIAYKYYGDSIVLKRIDMGSHKSDVNIYGIDVYFPGATGDSYKVTLVGYAQLQTATGAEQSVSRNLIYHVKRMSTSANTTAVTSASITSKAISSEVDGKDVTVQAEGATSVSLYDLSGKLIARKNVRNGAATLSAGSATGTVIYTVNFANKVRKSGKIIIK